LSGLLDSKYGSSRFAGKNASCFYAKTAKRLRGYLIRLTREYTDGGMDSRADNSDFISISEKQVFR
jgi:hypothetical protein